MTGGAPVSMVDLAVASTSRPYAQAGALTSERRRQNQVGTAPKMERILCGESRASRYSPGEWPRALGRP